MPRLIDSLLDGETGARWWALLWQLGTMGYLGEGERGGGNVVLPLDFCEEKESVLRSAVLQFRILLNNAFISMYCGASSRWMGKCRGTCTSGVGVWI